MENKELLNKIKVYRAMKNISQEELAVAIGVTRKTINSRPLKSTHLRDIARKQCPADFFNK